MFDDDNLSKSTLYLSYLAMLAVVTSWNEETLQDLKKSCSSLLSTLGIQNPDTAPDSEETRIKNFVNDWLIERHEERLENLFARVKTLQDEIGVLREGVSYL